MRYTSKEYNGKAEYRNPYMVSVTLPASRKRRSTSESVLPEGFEISLSNDDTHYGESVNLVIFDDQCFDCNSTLITCIDRVRYNLNTPFSSTLVFSYFNHWIETSAGLTEIC